MAGGAAAAGYFEHIVETTTSLVLSVLSSSNFNPVEIRESKFTLSQAYSLLWQEKESGEVSGRKCSEEKNSMAVGATILDLVVKGKIEVDVQPKSLLGVISYDKNYVRVINDSPTDSHLDVALFNKLLKRHEEKPNDPYTVERIIRDTVWKNKSDSSATASLDSLVEMGILDRKEKKIFGRKYPTINSGPEEEYVEQIRKIALDGATPDSFMWTLLALLRGADNFYTCSDPFLERHFSKAEYKGAKERIKHLVDVKSGPGKYEAM